MRWENANSDAVASDAKKRKSTSPEQKRYMRRLCERLDSRRKALHLGNNELAEMAGIAGGDMSKILRGQKPGISVWILVRIVRALAAGSDIDWIMYGPKGGEDDAWRHANGELRH